MLKVCILIGFLLEDFRVRLKFFPQSTQFSITPIKPLLHTNCLFYVKIEIFANSGDNSMCAFNGNKIATY